MNLWRVFIAEMAKSHQHHFHNKMIYFSMLIWPAILFLTAYYSFKPFDLSSTSPISKYVNVDQIVLFLLMGYLAYTFFWSLVQSAWQMAYERQAGTLEMIFLTPVHKFTMMLSRAAGNLLEAVWLFSVFTLLVIILSGQAGLLHWQYVPIAIFVLSFSAVVWGCFLNIVFLFSRDASILFTILEEPMQFFAGVRLPILALPLWGKALAMIFPLTYVLNIIRGLVLDGKSIFQLINQFVLLAAILASLLLVSYVLLKKAEQHAKKTGNMVLF
ncbi:MULTISPECIES: ABC transporter permease [Bacillus]|uniref:ABC transporter permease n=1 Tax=Bacillus TaxID=1386 RepID=UPI0002FF0E51|nr:MULTISPECIES: ABC transporter permease [Bacillus]